ncbi:MAG TPA: hypothetical protein VNZ06_03830 [Steroidobacteraceae bacterium]|nr:hypothetical protein [Steroidobacteraceae bacterium]
MNARIDTEQRFQLVGSAPPPRKRVSASLVPADSTLRWRGNIDAVSLEHGIEGWVLDLAAPQTLLRLQLLAGDELIAEGATGVSRDDVVSLLGSSASPGFRFSAEILAELDPKLAELPLCVTIAGENVEIVAGATLPSVAQLMSGELAQPIGFDLMDRLGLLRQGGVTLSASPLRPGPWKEVGCIEVLSIDEGGLVWVQGWMRRCAAIDAPAAVVDGRKEPAGFVYTWFERADLNAEHCGFIGLIHSSWVPTPATAPLLFIKGEEVVFVRGLAPTRIIRHAEFAATFRNLANRCHTGPTAELLQLIDSPSSWTPTQSGASAALDTAVVIPGFGCVAQGWAVNPLSRAVRFALRFGPNILSADEDSIIYSPRPDLSNVAPGCDALLQQAGFVVAFRGEVPVRALDSPLLKVVYEDGSSSRHALETRIFRTIGSAVEPDALLTHYPSLPRERFFPELAFALRKADRMQAASWRPIAITPCLRAIVCVLPPGRSGAYLLAEQLRAHVSVREGAGVLLIAGQTTMRSDAITLRASLAEDAGIPCSLIAARRCAQALYALDSMLKAIGCERFVFLGPGMLPTGSGWDAALEYLGSAERGGCFFGVTDPTSEEPDSTDCAAAIGWTRSALEEWLPTALPLLGGHAKDNGLGQLGFRRIPRSVCYSRELDGSAFVQAVNRVTR